jgi:hypothetical protein
MSAALDAVPEARGAARPPAPADRTLVDETVYAGSTPLAPSQPVAPRPAIAPVGAALARMSRAILAIAGRALARLEGGSRRRKTLVRASLVAALVIIIAGPVLLRRSPEIPPPVPPGPVPAAAGPASATGRQELRDARAAAVRARLCFEKLWWSEGVTAFRTAVHADPELAGDPVLVGHVIRSLQSPQFHERGAAFLRELGEAARPRVEEAARTHPSPGVRARATLLLQSWPRS